MSNELADILAEMRTYFQAKKRGNPEHRPWHQVLSDWADRIDEAARKRETGDAAALRAALEDVVKYLGDIIPTHREVELVKSARAALSAPPRNCDVGTPKEQRNRFEAFCESHWSAIDGMCDVNCPCLRCGDKMVCLCKWAQMPYEAEGGAS